jgi:two-component system alkaline phosphatase synthesis response regulator PhoP
MPHLVAVVEDDSDTRRLIEASLQREDLTVESFPDAVEFLRFVETTIPDLVVLDIMMPDMDGLELCRILRSDKRTAPLPIMFVTAKTSVMDRVVGLEVGADDYLPKPFSPREFTARVRALLRRTKPQRVRGSMRVGPLEIDTERFEARYHGCQLDLTTTEFRLLAALCKRQSFVLLRSELLEELWEERKIVTDRTIDAHIK